MLSYCVVWRQRFLINVLWETSINVWSCFLLNKIGLYGLRWQILGFNIRDLNIKYAMMKNKMSFTSCFLFYVIKLYGALLKRSYRGSAPPITEAINKSEGSLSGIGGVVLASINIWRWVERTQKEAWGHKTDGVSRYEGQLRHWLTKDFVVCIQWFDQIEGKC